VNGNDIVVGVVVVVVVNQSISQNRQDHHHHNPVDRGTVPPLSSHSHVQAQSVARQSSSSLALIATRARESASTSSSVPEAKLRNNISSPNVSNVVCTNATDRQSSIGHEDAKPHHDIPWPSYSCCEAKQTLDQRLALTLTHAFIDGWCKMRVPYSWNIVVREGVARESNQQACLA